VPPDVPPPDVMSSDTDRILDRRRLKRGLTLWRIVAVIAVVAAGLAVFSRFDVPVDEPYVAWVAVDGIILRDDELVEAILDVSDDDDAKALLVEIDSPGGGFVASEALYRAFRDVAATKPVVAVIGDTGASGGYMAAIGADYIVAHAGSVTGSIGVLLETADITGLLEKLGIKPEIVKSDPLKAQPNPMEPFSDEARANIQGVISDLHQAFVEMVAERRGMAYDDARALADGRIYSGRQAVQAGLVDEVGGVDEALAWLSRAHDVSDELPLHDITPVDELEQLRGVVGKALFSERLTLDGVLALWHPQAGF